MLHGQSNAQTIPVFRRQIHLARQAHLPAGGSPLTRGDRSPCERGAARLREPSAALRPKRGVAYAAMNQQLTISSPGYPVTDWRKPVTGWRSPRTPWAEGTFRIPGPPESRELRSCSSGPNPKQFRRMRATSPGLIPVDVPARAVLQLAVHAPRAHTFPVAVLEKLGAVDGHIGRALQVYKKPRAVGF